MLVLSFCFKGKRQDLTPVSWVASIVANWGIDQLTKNTVVVDIPGATQQFVRLPDGSFNPPPGSADAISLESDSSYKFRMKNGTEIDFDPAGKLEAWTDANGNSLSFTFGGDDLLDTVSNTFGRTLTLTHDSNDRVSSVSDGNGRTVLYGYDSAGNLVSFTNANEETTTYEYDEPGRLFKAYAPEYPKDISVENAFVENTYDALDRVTEQYNAHRKLYQYFYSGFRTEEIDPLGSSKVYEYDTHGSLTAYTDAVGRRTTSEYDAHRRLVEQVFPEGNSVVYEYDANNNVETVSQRPKTWPVGTPIVLSFEYELTYNKVTKVTDARGNVTDFTYFPGTPNLQKIEQPAINSVRPTTSFTYTTKGRIETQTDPEGRVTKFEYHATTDDVTKVIVDEGTGRLNLTTQLTYDAVGNVATRTDARGNVTSFDYDVERRLLKATPPSPFASLTTEFSYDANGRLVETRVATGDSGNPYQVSRTAYTRSDKQASAIDAEGHTTTFTYDDADRLVSTTDADARETQITYYADGSVHQTKQVVSATPVTVRTNTYTGNGQLDAVTDAEGNDIDFDYDDFDRLDRTTYEDTTFEESVYDAAGNVTEVTTRAGDVIGYTYDALNRESAKDAPTGFDDVVTAYDKTGRVDTVTVNGTDVFDHDYDTAGRLASVERPDGKTIDYDYDADGNRTSLTYPGGTFEITYEYDELGRPTKVKEGTTDLAVYTYTSRLESAVTLANTTTASYTANIGGDLAELAHTMTGESPSFGLYYNHSGQVVNRVISDSAYAWDASGTGTTTYTPNTLNQYGAVDATTYGYDNNGNLTSDGSSSFAYDYENRMTSATVSAVTTAYTYDAFGRRDTRTVGSNTTEKFLYDGVSVIEEYAAGAPDTLAARYVYGPGIDQPIYMERSSNRYYYHFDHQGSVVALTDTSGYVVERYTYSPFGEVDSASSVGNPYLYTGRRFDGETGLYYYRNRVYSTALGRFLQPDPLGIADGLNLYGYVGNDPLNFTDPTGLLARESIDRAKQLGQSLYQGAADHVAFTQSLTNSGVRNATAADLNAIDERNALPSRVSGGVTVAFTTYSVVAYDREEGIFPTRRAQVELSTTLLGGGVTASYQTGVSASSVPPGDEIGVQIGQSRHLSIGTNSALATLDVSLGLGIALPGIQLSKVIQDAFAR